MRSISKSPKELTISFRIDDVMVDFSIPDYVDLATGEKDKADVYISAYDDEEDFENDYDTTDIIGNKHMVIYNLKGDAGEKGLGTIVKNIERSVKRHMQMKKRGK